jgi:esterase/lipase
VKKLHAETLTIFMTGEEDELIDASNSKALYELCPCKEKHLKTFEGTHNSCRPYLVMLEVMELVMRKVRKSKN